MTEKPLLSEETCNILHRLLDKLDVGKTRIQLKLNSKETPELYDFEDQYQVDTVWNDLIELDKCGIIILKIPPHQRQGYEIYHGGLLTLRLEAEEKLRHWVRRPALDPHLILWHSALNKYQDVFEDAGEALKRDPILFVGKNYEHVAAAFAQVATVLQNTLTLRQLSARCFWGESKFLDNNHIESLILSTYPSLAKNIKQRPLLLSVSLPVETKHVLFIENQDTFLEMAACTPPSIALVYLGGYRGTAVRSREPGQAIFTYLNPTNFEARTHFQKFWLGQSQTPCYFWGDLDYAGMSILEALKKVFPTVEAWQPGYGPMLKKIKEGLGHSPGAQNKHKQFTPGNTGCDYSDHILIPAIDEYGAFLDQEAVQIDNVLKTTR